MTTVRYGPLPSPSYDGKVVVGLDTWVWRRLSQAERRHDEAFVAVLRTLESHVQAGRVVVPLDATIYFELHTKSWPIRDAVADVAARLSGWATFLPAHIRVRREIDEVLRESFGRPLILPPAPPDIGKGAHFAFTGESHGLLLDGTDEEIARLVQSLGGAAQLQRLLESFDAVGERLLLAGPSSDAEVDLLRREYGYRPESARDIAIERQDRHRRMQASLQSSVDLRSRPSDLVDASELGVEINEILNQRLNAAGIELSELLERGRDGLSDLLNRIPSSVVRRAIIRRAISDRGRDLTMNDISDADLYAAVIPASDIVIAERAVIGALSTREVRSAFGARLVGGRELSSLPDLVSAAVGRK